MDMKLSSPWTYTKVSTDSKHGGTKDKLAVDLDLRLLQTPCCEPRLELNVDPDLRFLQTQKYEPGV